MANLRELSKNNWDGKESIENVNAGSLQRIADAAELMALNYTELIRQRDHYKRWTENYQKEIDALSRTNAGLRGTITRMKNKATGGWKPVPAKGKS